MSDNYAELITEFPLFQGFTTDGAKRLLNSGEVKQCAADEVLMKEGEKADFVVLLLTGGLEVFVKRGDNDVVLTETKPGTITGELAVLCGIPRSASVRAQKPSPWLKWSASVPHITPRDSKFIQRLSAKSAHCGQRRDIILITSRASAHCE